MEAVEIVAQNAVLVRDRRRNSTQHAAAREALLDRAMGLKWKRKSSQKLRRGRRPSEGLGLCRARRLTGAIVGTVRLWDVADSASGRSGGAAARPAGRRPVAEERRHRQGIDVARYFGSRAPRPPRDPAGRRRALLCALRLFGREDRRGFPCPALTSATASWRWSWCPARSTMLPARSSRPAARRRPVTGFRKKLPDFKALR